eukprot:Skav201900  [mRNA]  locus=scaffold550:1007870:1009721:+ [translate_table: standard]
MSLPAAWSISGKRLVELPNPQVRHFTGEGAFADLPLRAVPETSATKLKYAFDVIEVPGDLSLDWDVLCGKLARKEFDELPEPLALKASLHKLVQLQVIKVDALQEGNPNHFIKMFTFEDKALVPMIKSACQGKLMQLDYGNRFKQGLAIFYQMLQNIHGWGILNYQLQLPMKNAASSKSQSSLQQGFDYIRLHGPRSSCNNRQTEWTEIEIHREDSPIYGWTAGLVEKSLKGYASANLFAEPVTNFFLTLHDLRPWFLHDVIIPLLPSLKDKSLVFMGLAEKGKTPAAQAIAMGMSEYWLLADNIENPVPSFRMAASLDQFRGDPGLKYRPDILDDADVSTIPPTKMKAFLDQSLEESFTVERWTAAKFDNKVNEGVEPQLAIGQSTIPFQTFYDIIAPAFGEKATKQDIMACLKRAHWVVNLKLATYIRKADGTKEADVPLIRHEDGDSEFISEDGKKMIARMRAGDMSIPDDWLMRRQWSHDLLSMVLESNAFPARTTSTRVHSPFTGKTEIVEQKPTLPASGRVCRLAEPEEPNCQDIALGASDEATAAAPLIQVKEEPAETFSKKAQGHNPSH